MTVLAATAWNTNADMILSCVELGYLRKEWLTLDPTYGKGNWWTKWRPDNLVTSDINDVEPVDFRCLPPVYADHFDAVAFDPPYVCIGGRKTTGIPKMHEAYGLTEAPRTPADLQDLIDEGLVEMHRVVRPGGIVLVKCQDYVSSGKLWPGTHYTLQFAESAGFTLVDRLEHISGVRPQPPGRRQVHARRNLSTLFVLQKAKR